MYVNSEVAADAEVLVNQDVSAEVLANQNVKHVNPDVDVDVNK